MCGEQRMSPEARDVSGIDEKFQLYFVGHGARKGGQFWDVKIQGATSGISPGRLALKFSAVLIVLSTVLLLQAPL
jgi:hypothetical protein